MKTAEEYLDKWMFEDSGIPAIERLRSALCEAYRQGCNDCAKALDAAGSITAQEMCEEICDSKHPEDF